MKVRFQADADFNQNIVRAVRRRDPAIDFQTAHEARLHGVDDDVVWPKLRRKAVSWCHTIIARCQHTLRLS
jgi:hypothetical protein